MTFLEFLQNRILLLDGGMGTLLQQAGLKPGEHPEATTTSGMMKREVSSAF